MKIGVLLTPMSDHNLRLVNQAGATDIVMCYPGLDLNALMEQQKRVQQYGMTISCIERLIPTLKFVHNLDGADEQIDGFKKLIGNMGKTGIKTLCYSWMPDDDWQRTSVDTLERGGATTTSFNLKDLHKAKVPTNTGYTLPDDFVPTTADQLWQNLEKFLKEVVPVAEESGVRLALHPDDPPIDNLNGQDRIIVSVASMLRAIKIMPSESNGICFCQGTFASRGDVDIPKAIELLSPHITMAHFRDVKGQVPSFQETFIDNGKTDMAACMAEYLKCSGEFVIRPDHVPTFDGEGNEDPGYKTLGRIHAIGYMKGLIDGLKKV